MVNLFIGLFGKSAEMAPNPRVDMSLAVLWPRNSGDGQFSFCKRGNLMRIWYVPILLCSTLILLPSTFAASQTRGKLKAYTVVRPARDRNGKVLDPATASAVSSLATFSYTVTSSRDGNTYTGAMVGQNPFGSGFTPTTVTTPVIPLIITTNAVATSVNKAGFITTRKGVTTFDPTIADTSCLSAPNDVPITLFQQSPIFQSANFRFGHTSVGDTQYVDAFQRGNFWQLVGGTDYHTLLNPVLFNPVSINVASASDGLSLPPSALGITGCGPLGILTFSGLNSLITGTLLPQLAAQGVDTSQFPVFLLYNVVMSGTKATDLNTCCILGFHDSTGTPVQTYSPIDFDTTGLFGPAIRDTSIAAHEAGEWMDDPFGNNPTPAWGHTGQVGGCQNNLEVGDPLTGTNVPTVRGANGFTYHLQELAFFSWFYGAPSLAVNDWFSDNNTFKMDAGPVCQ